MASKNRLSAASSYFLSLLRIVVAFLFGCHGAQKALGLLGGHRMPLVSLLGLAGVLELLGGTLILLGLFTRPVAFVLSGEMVVAYFRAHAGKGLFPIQNGGELAVLYCFVFVYMIFAGGGAFSLDALVRNKE
jgi:putative oxidoreductase